MPDPQHHRTRLAGNDRPSCRLILHAYPIIGGLREKAVYRGKVVTTRFEQDSLREYAEVFKTVSVASAYYDFRRRDNLKKLADAVPDVFRFGVKVTDVLTVKKSSNLGTARRKGRTAEPEFSQRGIVCDGHPPTV